MAETIELKQYVQLLWSQAWVIIVGALLFAGATLLVCRNITPTYTAATRLRVYQVPIGMYTPDNGALQAGERLATTYAQMLGSQPLLAAVGDKLDLGISPAHLASRVQVHAIRETQLIDLVVTDTNPEQAALIANGLAAGFIVQEHERQNARLAGMEQQLERQLDMVEHEMQRTTRALENLDQPGTPAGRAERARLQDRLEDQRNQVARFRDTLDHTRLVHARSTSDIQIVEPAVTPTAPGHPRTTMYTLLAAIAGASLAVVGIFVYEYLDETVRTGSEVLQRTGLPLLGEVGPLAGRIARRPLVTVDARYSAKAEPYRSLRVAIECASLEQPMQTVLVAGSRRREGTTTTLANLAVAFGQAGRQVILVDANLHHPALHRLFDVSSQQGLTNVLLQEGLSVESLLQPTTVGNLRLLPAGPPLLPAADALGSAQIVALIEHLKTRADLVLFDCPALLDKADGMLLARHCDATLLLVGAAATRVPLVQRAISRLQQARACVAGVVLMRRSGGLF